MPAEHVRTSVEPHREFAGARPQRPASTDMSERAVYGPCHARVRRHRRIGNTTPIVADAPASFEAPSYVAAIEIGIAGSARSG
ncbi:hypothetical protein C6P97_29480 [Burkholderia multivorans]|uniref:Uncharacterized protein n=1 Tax=Burkholderia multivorans TaxID=87883 RepID=A0AB37B2F1_9BURK|nr:hypothetical protein C6P97_29480 [Burkholderia multivorans]PRE55418.1 hypothetical protein C6P99_02315 [Burkholderia multivorans]